MHHDYAPIAAESKQRASEADFDCRRMTSCGSATRELAPIVRGKLRFSKFRVELGEPLRRADIVPDAGEVLPADPTSLHRRT